MSYIETRSIKQLVSGETPQPLYIGGTSISHSDAPIIINSDKTTNLAPRFNFITNGAFNVWQRGTSFSTNGGYYTADRWYSPVSLATVAREESDLPLGFRYGIKFTTTSENGFSQFNQAFEATDVIAMRGKKVTASGWIKISSNFIGDFAVQILYNTSSESYASSTTVSETFNIGNYLTSEWTYFSKTFTIPLNAFGMRIEHLPLVAQPINVIVKMTGMKLEFGENSTPYTPEPVAETELKCKRFFQRFIGGVGMSLSGIAYSVTTQIFFTYSLPIQLRTSATPVAVGQIWVSDQYLADFSTTSPTVTSAAPNNYGGRFVLTGFSGLTVGRWYSAPAGSIGSGYIEFSADL